MKSTTDQLIANLYRKYPKVFDQPDDTELVKMYITKVLGLSWNDLAEVKYKMIPFESFRRKKQLMVSRGELQISEINKKVRHVKEQRVREEVKSAATKTESEEQPVERKPIRYEFVGSTAIAIYG